MSKKGGSHGAWKVAYADFVTAMMAFFLLLWLVSVSDKDTLRGVATYFTPTESISEKVGLGFDGGTEVNTELRVDSPNSASSSVVYGSPSKGHRLDSARLPTNMSEVERDHFIDIINSIQEDVRLQKFSDNIRVDVTNEGLNIQIMDSDNRSVFKPNSSELQPYMQKIVDVLGNIISKQPNYISISGHTASMRADSDIDSWEISSARANEIRKYMSKKLINQHQVVKIIGKSDREPFDVKDPFNIRNIRVSITLLNDQSISSYQRSLPE